MRKTILLVLLVSIVSKTWSQENSSKKRIKLGGDLSVSNMLYFSNTERNFPNFAYLISGSSQLTLGQFYLPFSVSYSNQGLDYRQPFNQYGVSPTFKWAKLNLGYRNLSFGKYSLAGHTMLGAGFEVTPGKFDVGFQYGRLNKATVLDTTNSILAPVSFDRMGWAAKIQYGKERGHIKLSVLSASDDPRSVSQNIQQEADDEELITPGQNVVTELAWKIPILKTLSWETTGAVSVFTADVNSPLEVVTDTLLLELGVPSFVVNNFTINASTNFFTAIESAIRLQLKHIKTHVKYTRIDPDFKSMGAYFFQNDVENLVYGLSFPMLKNSLYFSGNIGFQRDNINGIKAATSNRLIGNASASYNRKAFGVDVSFYNYNNDQRPRLQQFADSLRIVQNNTNLSITPRYSLNNESSYQTIVLVLSTGSLRDFNRSISADAPFRNVQTQNASIMYSYAPTSEKYQLNATINTTKMKDNLGANYHTIGFNAGASSKFIDNKLNGNISMGLFSSKQGNNKGLVFTNSIGAGYKITDKLNARCLMLSNISRNVVNAQNQLINEMRSEIGLNFIF